MDYDIGLRGINGLFFRKLIPLTAASWANRLSMSLTTTDGQEKIRWLSDVPAVREWSSGRKVRELTEEGFNLITKPYEATLSFHQDDLRRVRGKSPQIDARIGDLARRVAEHWGKLITTAIELNPTCYDGSALFADAHSEGASGSQDNNLGASATTPSNPTAAEMATAIKTAIQAMAAYKDSVGEPINAEAASWMVMVPPNMQWAALEAVNNAIVIIGGAASQNVLASQTNVEVRVNPRLTSTSVFYLFRTDSELKPFVALDEYTETKEKDDTFDNRRMLFGVSLQRVVGVAWWQYASKVTLS